MKQNIKAKQIILHQTSAHPACSLQLRHTLDIDFTDIYTLCFEPQDKLRVTGMKLVITQISP